MTTYLQAESYLKQYTHTRKTTVIAVLVYIIRSMIG